MSTAKTTAGIKINGESEELSFVTQQILSITVSKEINKIPTATITLKDGIPNKQDFPISNQDTFKPGTPIEILIGEPAGKQTVFKGIVTKHGLQVRKDKPSILTVECKDEAVRLAIGRKSRFWLDKSDSEIFQKIFEDYSAFPNMTLQAEDTKDIIVHDQMTQYYASDWDFMSMRAEALAKYVFVDDGQLSIQQPDLTQNEAFALTYGAAGDTPERSRIWEFESEMDARYQFNQVQTLGWDYAKQEVTQANPNFTPPSEAGNVSSDSLTSVIQLDAYQLHHHARMNEPELTAFANAVKQKSVLHKNRGRIKFDGRADIHPGKMVLLEGVGERFNGKVFVSRVFHTFQPGRWFTQIQFGLPFCWFQESEHIPNPAAQGLLPTTKGLHIGTVLQVKDDNEARKQERRDANFRVKVNISGFHQNNEGIWARMATFYATNGQGAVFLPEKDDEVVIGYVGEDSREPVILGALYSAAHAPPLQNENENYLKGIITKKGHKITFDEEKDILTVETKGGNSFVLNDSDKKISLKDINSNEIIMDSSGINISNNSKINIKSNALSLEAVTIDIKGSGATAINSPSGGPVRLGAGIAPVASLADGVFLPPIPAPVGFIGPPTKNIKVFV